MPTKNQQPTSKATKPARLKTNHSQKTQKISIFTVSEGHLSLAKAAREILQDQYEISFYHHDSLLNLYVPLYRFAPAGNRIPYEISKNKPTQHLVRSLLRKNHQSEIESFMEQEKPDLVITTSFLVGQAVQAVASQQNLPSINIVSDPRYIHPLIVNKQATTNFVFDEQSKHICQKIDPQLNVTVGGWLVQKKYQPLDASTNKSASNNYSASNNNSASTSKADTNKKLLNTKKNVQKQQLKKQLGLNPEIPTYLITSGSEGTTAIMGIIPSLMLFKEPLQLVVACGNNRQLYKILSLMANHLNQDHKPVRLIPLKFTDQLHLYMQSADLILGKAGPNTIFEAVATHTPFMAIAHVAGQETGNLKLIKEYGIGWVEENPIKAASLIKEFTLQPQKIDQKMPAVVKLASYNRQSGQVLRQIVLDQLGK